VVPTIALVAAADPLATLVSTAQSPVRFRVESGAMDAQRVSATTEIHLLKGKHCDE